VKDECGPNDQGVFVFRLQSRKLLIDIS